MSLITNLWITHSPFPLRPDFLSRLENMVPEPTHNRPTAQPQNLGGYSWEDKYGSIRAVLPHEPLERYAQGGFHPIALGDTFHNGKYTIRYKLGYGGYSTVWLARDNQQKNRYSFRLWPRILRSLKANFWQTVGLHEDQASQGIIEYWLDVKLTELHATWAPVALSSNRPLAIWAGIVLTLIQDY
jgi:serine/threonine protein kinase